MIQDNPKHTIYAKEYITEKEYSEINQLQLLCINKDHINLKLELDYKLFISKNAKQNSSLMIEQSDKNEAVLKEQANMKLFSRYNEFLYYIDDILVAYLGISCFDGNSGELNGMTHPDFRGKGIFHKLFTLAARECQKGQYSKVLLLTDNNSDSGSAFIKSAGGLYDFSEYRMKLIQYPSFEENSPIVLRIAQKTDRRIIHALNTDLFGDKKEDSDANSNEHAGQAAQEEDETDWDPNTTIYMVELSGKVIGKIQVEYNDNSAFIFGFGILPDFRGKGYGKAALQETLRIFASKNIKEVSLDVVCTNRRALNLYTGCGFEQQSIMDYYLFPLTCNQKVANI